MAREPENLILQYLRRLDAGMQLLREDVTDLKRRMAGVEESLVGVNRRLDRLERGLDRAEA